MVSPTDFSPKNPNWENNHSVSTASVNNANVSNNSDSNGKESFISRCVNVIYSLGLAIASNKRGTAHMINKSTENKSSSYKPGGHYGFGDLHKESANNAANVPIK